MIYTIALNPALDKTVLSEHFETGRLNRVLTERSDPGGKSINVSRALAALSKKSILLGILGGQTGDRIADRLRAEGLDCDFAWSRSETRTNLKIVDPISSVVTELDEPGAPADPALLQQVRQKLLHRLERDDLVVFSGSLPPGAPAGLYRDWIKDCRAMGAHCFLDTSGEALALGLSAAPDFVKPNREELQLLSGRRLDTLGEVVEAGRALLWKGVKQAVISLGAEGALLLTGETVLYGTAPKVAVLSTVGAGDTMVAALLYSHLCGFTPEETLCASIAAATAKVVRNGTEPPLMSDIQSVLPRITIRKL